MTARQALVFGGGALLIGLAIALDWASLPSSLGAEPQVLRTVTANYRQSRGGYADLEHASGWRASVNCGRVRALCESLKTSPGQAVQVRVVRVGLLEDIWLLGAAARDQEFVALPELEEAFARSKMTQIAIALVFFLAAAVFLVYSHRANHSPRTDAA